MTDFKAKMHQIRFWFFQTPLGNLQCSPRPSNWIWTPLRGRRRALGWGRGGKGEEKGKEDEVEGREREGPKLLLNQGRSEPCYATDIGLCLTNKHKTANSY